MQYKLLHLDTNALSNLLKDKAKLIDLNSFYFQKGYVFCYSPFSILEIQKRNSIYENFLEAFSIIPSFVLKGYETIRDEEINNYFTDKRLSAIDFSPFDAPKKGLLPVMNDLKLIFSNHKITNVFKHWNEQKENILTGILSLKSNFKSQSSKYTKEEIRYFIKLSVLQQLERYSPEFINRNKITLENINIDKFPSFKAMLFIVFYKFYSDNRKPQLSDVYDILITTTIPYVDIFITENQLYDSCQKIKKIDSFIDNLELRKVNSI